MNVEIAERLAKRRREAGYSQESLAEQLGVSRQAVSKWERSESSPDTDNLIALAQIYGVSLDELLYVDEDIKEDVAFEAQDRAPSKQNQVDSAYASARQQCESEPQHKTENTKTNENEEDPQNSSQDSSDSSSTQAKVNFGKGGIHIKDGNDYVHVSWRDGIHVKDSKKGEEVHVGWDGIHVNDKNGQNYYHTEDHKVNWDDPQVVVNGKEYKSWQEVCDDEKSHGYNTKVWESFPFWILIILAYVLLGVFLNAWLMGLFVFLLIPIVAAAENAIRKRKPSQFLAPLYPILALAWFLYMAFVVSEPHPAWIIFLTIPLYEWFVYACSRAYKRHKKRNDPIEVEGEFEGKVKQ